MSKLYPRHRQLVRLLMKGLILKEAAGQLGLARSTVNKYMVTARKRLGCRTTEQLMYKLGMERST